MNKKNFWARVTINILALLILAKSGNMETIIRDDIFSLDSVCPGQQISMSIGGLENIRSCTKIEGNLEIVRIEFTESFSEFDAYSFPRLREITGFLIVYRVNKLKSLSQLFPNLSVIRGETLMYNYALVVYEMQDLEEVGLWSLTRIVSGGVRIELNPRLCYVNTIQWSHITGSDENMHLSMNRAFGNCVEMCPRSPNGSDSCIAADTVVRGRKLREPRCWNSRRCQKICPKECSSSCYLDEEKLKCCHSECLGGCGGPTDRDCDACVNVSHNGTCTPRCPVGTLKFNGRWCLTKAECVTHRRWYNENKSFKVHDGLCLPRCPDGFAVDTDDPKSCVECVGPCPKVCRSLTVQSISSASMAKGCTIIDGFLDIQIRGGSQIAHNLEENLGAIEEVRHYVKIFQAHSIVSLRFLKNLKIINGKRLYYNRYALVVLDNQNLQDIWDSDYHSNLTIGNDGGLFFHSNRKLCLSKIESLVRSVGRNFSDISENEISRSSNGDSMPCRMHSMMVNVSEIGSREAYLHWSRVEFSDDRQVLGYMVYYRKVAEGENITMYSQKDACETDTWKNDFAKKLENQRESFHLLQNLEPFTNYAFYVQTYGISSIKDMASSELLFFKTLPDAPSQPRDIVFYPSDPNELLVKWSPPSSPFGIVTHYYVYWHPIKFDESGLLEKNYCEDRLLPLKQEEVVPAENVTVPFKEDCCSCSKDSDLEYNLESKSFERLNQINFHDHMLNSYYTKKMSIEPKRFKRHQTDSYAAAATNSSNEASGFPEPYEVAVVYNRTEIIISNLRHYQEYNVEVVACHDHDGTKKICSPRLFSTGMTLEKKSADDIDETRVAHVLSNSTEVVVTWPAPDEPNGVTLLYEVELDNPFHEQKRTVCIPAKIYGLIGGFAIKGLVAGNWSYRIRSTSRAGIGSWTKNFYVLVPQKSGSSMLKNVAAPLVALFLASCIVCVLIFLYIQRMRLRASKLRISNNPNYLLTEDVYTPDEWEVERSKVTCLKELGSGSFGKVFEGTVRNLAGMPSITKVAIKTTHNSATTRDVICFLNEASRMKVFENGCNHVVKLYGVVSQGRPPYVIMELMSNGDLREFLRSCRHDSQGNGIRSQPSLKEMIKMAAEIADGMAFLESKNYVHRDLASRNCLVSENMVVKIADFGMTRDIYITDYYRKGSVGMLPVRWMPKESLEDGYFDHKSDVWSYGVVLWEIVTLGNQPYMGLANEQVCQYIINGGCLNKPEGCHPIIADLMTDCWKADPKSRVSFEDVLLRLRPHLPLDFIKESFYFTCCADCAPDDGDDIPHVPLGNLPSNEDHHDRIALIADAAQPPRPDSNAFNHRGLPMPLSLTMTNLVKDSEDEYILSETITRFPSGETSISVITPDYVNSTNHKL